MSLLATAVISATMLCTRPGVEYVTGLWTFYHQNPTDGTIDYHQNVSEKLPQDLSDFDGVVALVLGCRDVGKEAWIRITEPHIPVEHWNRWKHVMVFDCGGDSESIENFFRPNNIIGELGYYLARDTGAMPLGRAVEGDFTFEDPTMVCPTTPTPSPAPTLTPINTPTSPLQIAMAVTRLVAPPIQYVPTRETYYVKGSMRKWEGVKAMGFNWVETTVYAGSLTLFCVSGLYTWWWLAHLLWKIKVWVANVNIAHLWRYITKLNRRFD